MLGFVVLYWFVVRMFVTIVKEKEWPDIKEKKYLVCVTK